MTQATYQLAVDHLKEQLHELLEKYVAQQKTMKQLQEENGHLKQLLASQKGVAHLAGPSLSTWLASMSGLGSHNNLSDTIDAYIQTIDVCITHFEKLSNDGGVGYKNKN